MWIKNSLYTLTNDSGNLVTITNYGGIVVSIDMPDRHGNMADVVLGFENVTGYEENPGYFGAVVGRYGNRIANGQFSIDGELVEIVVESAAGQKEIGGRKYVAGKRRPEVDGAEDLVRI